MQLLKQFYIEPLNPHLYEVAFLHESYSNEHGLKECYERLEFLGDTVLDLVVSEYLYYMDSSLSEGQLTSIRANYVCKKALYTYSMELGLDKYLKIGAGVELTPREVDSIISDVFESFIGALYLDLGMDKVKGFLYETVIPHIEKGDIFFYDYKSELKQLCDQNGVDVIYELLHEVGEPHDKTFTTAAMINGKKYGSGVGGSKKEAQQSAAKVVLDRV